MSVTSSYNGNPYSTASFEVALRQGGASKGRKKYIHDFSRQTNCGKDKAATQGSVSIPLYEIYSGAVDSIELALTHYACVGWNTISLSGASIEVLP